MTDPIRKQIDVPLPPQAAFDLFTRDIASWWPVESHSLSAAQDARPQDVTMDPFEGGHVTEETHDGKRLPWATVTDWSPGRRLALSWYVGRDESEATEVVVAFAPIEGGTRVDLSHGGFDALPDGETMLARYTQGWDLVLGHCFGGACAAKAA